MDYIVDNDTIYSVPNLGLMIQTKICVCHFANSK